MNVFIGLKKISFLIGATQLKKTLKIWWITVNLRIESFFFKRGFDDTNEFLTYQLSMVVYWTTMVMTGNGEFGFDSGENAWETAITSKEGSRRVNYPILIRGGSDKKYWYWSQREQWLEWEQFKKLND